MTWPYDQSFRQTVGTRVSVEFVAGKTGATHEGTKQDDGVDDTGKALDTSVLDGNNPRPEE